MMADDDKLYQDDHDHDNDDDEHLASCMIAEPGSGPSDVGDGGASRLQI